MDQHVEKSLSSDVLVALGGNVTSSAGSPQDTVLAAIDALAARLGPVVARSRLYSTPCYPAGAGPDYVNAVVALQTNLKPEAVLVVLHAIEAEFERVRTTRWASRTLDLDLLTFNEKIRPDQSTLREWVNLPTEKQARIAPEELILPHPRLQDRAFVLVPAAEIAPDWRHPLLGRTIREMRDALDPAEVASVVPLDGENSQTGGA